MGFLSKLDTIAGSLSSGLGAGLAMGAQMGQLKQESQRYADQQGRLGRQEGEEQKSRIREQAQRGDQGALVAAGRYGPEFEAEIQSILEGRLKPQTAQLQGALGKAQGLRQGADLTTPQGLVEARKDTQASQAGLRQGAGELEALSGQQMSQTGAPGQRMKPAIKPAGMIQGAMRAGGTAPYTPGPAGATVTSRPEPFGGVAPRGTPAAVQPMTPEERSVQMSRATAQGMDVFQQKIGALEESIAGLDFKAPWTDINEGLEAFTRTLQESGLDRDSAVRARGRMESNLKSLRNGYVQTLVETVDEPKVLRRLMVLYPDVDQSTQLNAEMRAITLEMERGQKAQDRTFQEGYRFYTQAYELGRLGDKAGAARALDAAVSAFEKGGLDEYAGVIAGSRDTIIHGQGLVRWEERYQKLSDMMLTQMGRMDLAQYAFNKYNIGAVPETGTAPQFGRKEWNTLIELEKREYLPQSEEAQAASAEMLKANTQQFLSGFASESPERQEQIIQEINQALNSSTEEDKKIRTDVLLAAGWSIQGGMWRPPATSTARGYGAGDALIQSLLSGGQQGAMVQGAQRAAGMPAPGRRAPGGMPSMQKYLGGPEMVGPEGTPLPGGPITGSANWPGIVTAPARNAQQRKWPRSPGVVGGGR